MFAETFKTGSKPGSMQETNQFKKNNFHKETNNHNIKKKLSNLKNQTENQLERKQSISEIDIRKMGTSGGFCSVTDKSTLQFEKCIWVEIVPIAPYSPTNFLQHNRNILLKLME